MRSKAVKGVCEEGEGDRPWNLSWVKTTKRLGSDKSKLTGRSPCQTCWSWGKGYARRNQGKNGRWLESKMLKTEIPEVVVISDGAVLGMTKE